MTDCSNKGAGKALLFIASYASYSGQAPSLHGHRQLLFIID